MATTGLWPTATPGRPYGGFSPKTAAPVITPPVTQLSVTATPGRRYAGFVAKAEAEPEELTRRFQGTLTHPARMRH